MMRRWLWTLLSCGAAASASAQPAGQQATISARLTPEGVRALVQLDHAVTRFDFSKADVDRKADMDILTPGLSWSEEGDSVIAEHPFRRFEIRIRPAARERDAKYPAFFRVGSGGVLFAPALKARDGWRTQLRLPTAHGETRVPVGRLDLEGSIYIGPAAYVTHGKDADFIASPDTPEALRERVNAIILASMRTYTKGLRIELDDRPVVVMAQGGPGQGFVGDVTPGPFVSLRFYGTPQDQASEDMAYRLTRFVSHEVFHFWNGSIVRSDGEGAYSWLHEGGADYAAVLASREAGTLDDAGMRNELASALTRCRRGLESQGNVGMDELKFLSAGVRYPCGIVIQWAASLGALRAGRGDFHDVWSRMIHAAKARADRTYTLGDFYESVGGSGSPPPTTVRLLTAERGPGRWNELEAELQALGADISAAPTPDSRRESMVFHLLGQVCKSGPRGFYAEPGRIRLQTNADCTLIPDNSILSSVEGRDVVTPDEGTYAAVQARCAAREDVRLVLDGKTEVAIPCQQDLAPARDAYVVHRWRQPPDTTLP